MASQEGLSTQAEGTALKIRKVTKRYGAVPVLNGIDFELREGEFLTLLGPSGSGKTTLLKIIAGFEHSDAGRLVLGGEDMTRMPPSRRDIGMVFQNYALFPHMTVEENVAFPLRMRSVPRREIPGRVRQFLEMVDLGEFASRYPAQLSGGQQQRVALARATVFGPRLLLLDEPFGALDRRLREAMQLQLRELQLRLKLSTIFITHDQEEALIMSDRIAVMRDGRLQQVAKPEHLYRRPVNEFVANFVGEANILSGTVAEDGAGRRCLRLEGGQMFPLPASKGTTGQPLSVLLRPEHPSPVPPGDEPDSTITGRISKVIYLGTTIKYLFEAENGLELHFRRQASHREEVLPVNTPITLGWSSRDLHLLQ
ncbi:ABC transporter ATP-binding protein [Paracoccus sp. S-4012]|uniref:ABC transporter ATP-binding protein n=1 Tax=Paracoccus sp. S-4012 TaxID=2665648 RepID=UPI0018A23A35|nr:ABC transporter ATP-binding protein [Paracoccus sp. S-4012]